MRLPKINFEEPGWAQFFIALLILSPIYVAIFAGRWAADTLPYRIVLPLVIAAFVLSWLLLAISLIWMITLRPWLRTLIAYIAAITAMTFGGMVLGIYREWALLAPMVGVNMGILFIGAYMYDRRRASSGDEDRGAGG